MLILVTIAVPSFRLLFFQLNVPKADVTVKATGKQWFWSYSYPDSKFEFDSLLACDQERTKCEQPRLLAVDNEMVVPVNKVGACAHDRVGCDPRIRGTRIWYQNRCDPGPHQRDMVQGRA